MRSRILFEETRPSRKENLEELKNALEAHELVKIYESCLEALEGVRRDAMNKLIKDFYSEYRDQYLAGRVVKEEYSDSIEDVNIYVSTLHEDIVICASMCVSFVRLADSNSLKNPLEKVALDRGSAEITRTLRLKVRANDAISFKKYEKLDSFYFEDQGVIKEVGMKVDSVLMNYIANNIVFHTKPED